MGVKGGAKLAKFIRKARASAAKVQGVKTEIGFFGPVAPLAAAHEFGKRDKSGGRVVPARPAFAQSMPELRKSYRDTLRREARGSLGNITLPMLQRAATAALGAVRESYENAPGPKLGKSQQARKAGTPGEGRKLVGTRGPKMIDHLEARVERRRVK